MFKDGQRVKVVKNDFSYMPGYVGKRGKVVPGVKAGTYRACLLQPPVEGGSPPPLVIPRKYTRFETATLQFEIKPEPNEVTIEIER